MDAKEIETLVGELETRVDRLRALYEQYFIGIERMAPAVPHKDVERRIQTLRKEQIRNTAVRFRFQMLIQRYNTYQTHWQRICRQIEEGTYKRDLLRAQRRMGPRPDAAPESVAPAPESAQPAQSAAPASKSPPPPKPLPLPTFDKLELDDFAELDAVINAPLAAPTPAKPLPPRPLWRKVEAKPEAPAPQQAAPPPPPKPQPPPLPKKEPPKAAPPPPAPTPPVARSPADLSDERLRQIYSQYVQTRRTQNESTATITYDAMAKSLRESSAKLREKHGKSVDFEVAVKDGKTVLKPVVKRQ